MEEGEDGTEDGIYGFGPGLIPVFAVLDLDSLSPCEDWCILPRIVCAGRLSSVLLLAARLDLGALLHVPALRRGNW